MSDRETEVDARGLLCPLPVLRAQKVLAGLPRGALVRLHATDAASWVDVPHFCTHAGHELVSATEAGGTKTYLIRRG
ncbi:sulfurtransferase TusA family protein [Phaeovulum sp.]|uniref:sulfurtransferase TusA family protein n=1 Tax=Phaeovulum sp. TaxID=2934796 RepID=UPI003564CAED